jgi:hypothetical protein
MFRKLLKLALGAITKKLLASVNFWNFQENTESRLDALESRLDALESRLTATESRVDGRLDKSEDRLNSNENRIGLIENPLNLHRGILETFYNPVNADPLVIEFAERVKSILTVSGKIDEGIARFGDFGDGGYVIVDDLRKSDILFSIGIGDNVSFDQKCEVRLSKVILVDHTVPDFFPPVGNFEIVRKPLVPGGASRLGVTIEQLLKQHSEAEDYLLKIDIEGDEWEVLNELASSTILKFRQIIMEFHGLNEFVKLDKKLNVLQKLAATHSPIVVHANNQGTHRLINGSFIPDVLEVTWVRTYSYTFQSGNNNDIRKLLVSNSPDLPDIWIDWIDGKPNLND